jgi:hypothetical protein
MSVLIMPDINSSVMNYEVTFSIVLLATNLVKNPFYGRHGKTYVTSTQAAAQTATELFLYNIVYCYKLKFESKMIT